MARNRINPKKDSLGFRSLGFRAASFFGAIPGVKWIPQGIPLFPGNGSSHERDLNALFVPIEVLKVYGSSEELMRKHDVVEQAAIISRDLPMYDRKRVRFAPIFEELCEDIRFLAKVAHDAETFLSDMGWTFDPEKGKVRRKEKKHRGKDFLAEAVWAIFVSKYQDKGNTAPAWRAISRDLSPYFEGSELLAKTGAPIQSAIQYRLRREKDQRKNKLFATRKR